VFYDLYLDLCKKNNVSPTKAALDIGISKATPSTWKKRGLTPQGDTLNKIASYFGVSIDYLLGKAEKAPINDESLSGVYLSYAKEAQEQGIPPEDIKLAIETIKKIRGLK